MIPLQSNPSYRVLFRRRASILGLSLIELIVVLALMSLVMMGVMVTIASWLKKHQRDAVAVVVSSFDQWGRSHSQSRNSELLWDLDSNAIAKLDSSRHSPFPMEEIAGDIEVLVTQDAEYRSGRVSIPYRFGSCPTWAIKIQPHSGAARWMICHVFTGEIEIHASNTISDTSIPQWIGSCSTRVIKIKLISGRE
jgi:type II secretory pathway pseudopilin PulG